MTWVKLIRLTRLRLAVTEDNVINVIIPEKFREMKPGSLFVSIKIFDSHLIFSFLTDAWFCSRIALWSNESQIKHMCIHSIAGPTTKTMRHAVHKKYEKTIASFYAE